MKRGILITLYAFLIHTALFAQDYEIDYPFENGYTLVHEKTDTWPAPEKRYGVIDSKNKLVVPMKYEKIHTCGVNGLFIITELNRKGLYSATEQKLIVNTIYYDIEAFREGISIVKIKKTGPGFLYGAINESGKEVIPLKYDYLGACNEGLINFEENKKMGFLDKNNNVVIPAMYANYSGFSDGLAAVMVAETGKYGFIDKNNKMVIAAEYEDAKPFYKGYTSVAKKKGYTSGSAGKGTVTVFGQWVVIDKTGRIIQERTFDNVSSLNAGDLFIIESDGKQGTMNTKGMPILPMEYSNVTVDKAGYTIFKTVDSKKFGMMNNVGTIIVAPNYDYVSHTTANRFYVLKDGKYTVGDVNNNVFIQPDSANGVILGKKRIIYYYNDKVKVFDLNGNPQKTITGLNLKKYGHSFSVTEDSVKLIMDVSVQIINLNDNSKKTLPYAEAGDFNDEGIFLTKRNEYDFYDYTGKKLNPKSYYSVVQFSEGICALQDAAYTIPFLADKTFKKIKDLSYNFQGPFSDGLGYATNPRSGEIVYLDKKGNEVFKLSAKEGSRCQEGLIAVMNYDKKYYLVSKTGKTVNPKAWESIGNFSDGLALVKENNKLGFIDMQGNVVIEPKFNEASSFTNGVAIVNVKGNFYQINKKGEPLNNTLYDKAGEPGNGTFPVKKDNMIGLIDSKGNTLIDFSSKYNNLLYMTDDRVWASVDGKWGLLDKSGNALTPFIYKEVIQFKNGYAVFKLGDKYGLMNKSGKWILPAEYNSLSSVYKNFILGIRPSETVYYSLK